MKKHLAYEAGPRLDLHLLLAHNVKYLMVESALDGREPSCCTRNTGAGCLGLPRATIRRRRRGSVFLRDDKFGVDFGDIGRIAEIRSSGCRWGLSLAFAIESARNDVVADLFVNEGGEIGRDDFVHVAVANDKSVAIWNGETRYVIAILVRYGRHLQWAEVEEDDDFWRCDEFADKLAENDWGRFASLVEENAEALDGPHVLAAIHFGELETPVVIRLDEVC